MLVLQDVCVRYGDLTILDKVELQVQKNQWLMIVGPNGAGKSTLINAIAQGVPYSGRITYDGKDVARFRPHELAHRIGLLAQHYRVQYDYSVREVVGLGRYAYAKGFFPAPSQHDQDMVDKALAETGLTSLADQSVLKLSGGELQRTFLAQVLAQDPQLLLLDEPTNHLDLAYQRDVFDLIRQWAAGPDKMVVSVVHDLSLARAFGSHALLLHQGRVVADGDIQSALNPAYLDRVYGLDVVTWMQTLLSQWTEDNDQTPVQSDHQPR